MGAGASIKPTARLIVREGYETFTIMKDAGKVIGDMMQRNELLRWAASRMRE
jgi:hypothetical protein